MPPLPALHAPASGSVVNGQLPPPPPVWPSVWKANAGIAMANVIAAVTKAPVNNKSMRLIKRYLLVRATPGGLLLITRGSFPTQRLQHNPLWGWAHPPNELFITTFFANFVECPECELRH